MAGFGSSLKAMEDRPHPMLVLGLGAGIVGLLFFAIIGAVVVGKSDEQDVAAGPAAETTDTTLTTDTTAVDPNATVPTDPGAGTVAPGTPGAPTPGATPAPGAAPTTVKAPPLVAPPAGSGIKVGAEDRTGVFPDRIEIRVHAPLTFDGAPLNLAEDPIKGFGIYMADLNDKKVNGRVVNHGNVIDDKYTVAGGSAAGDAIVDAKPFFAVGTLGVDQIAQVAAKTRRAGIPYMAAGGSEALFKDIGMFQIAGSYDTHLVQLAKFLGKETKLDGSPYKGKTKVGVTQLDSDYIFRPVDTVFRQALAQNGLELVKVVKIEKPTVQSTYQQQLSDLRTAGAQIVVAAQDPISTGRMTKECGNPPSGPGQTTPICPWMWTFSNFANESDVALQLMGGHWSAQRVKGLAGGCYYLPKSGSPGKVYEPASCGSMNQAHDIWVKRSGQADWEKDGQGGASGYQLVRIWLKALKDVGTDPTRGKLVSAMLGYEGYNDLVSSPITFKGSANLAHGADRFVVYEARDPNAWTQVTPGFVEF